MIINCRWFAIINGKNKKLLILFAAACIILSAFCVCAGEDVRVVVNDNALVFDQQPVIENNRTLVPLRAIFEALGAEVNWDENTKTITVHKENTNIVLTVDECRAFADGREVELDVAPKIINDRTLVPVRFVAESMDCFVGWQEDTKTVFIADGDNKPERNLSVHYIDVGQADSILIMLPNGQNMLIDAGNNADVDLVINYLKEQGIAFLDYVIGTHPHEDHIGGLDMVIDYFDAGYIYMPEIQHSTKTFEDVLIAVQKKNLQIRSAKAGINIISSNGLCVDIIAPAGDFYKDLNDYSAVIKITYLNNTFLFMADAGKLSENQITADVKADVLKVGHHGSDTSTSITFLGRVSPDYAVISVGKGNPYGHPSQSVLDLLNSHGVCIYRTDEDGTIIAASDGYNIIIDSNKGAKPICGPLSLNLRPSGLPVMKGVKLAA